MNPILRIFLLLVAGTLLTGCLSRQELIRQNIDESNRVHKMSVDSAVNTITCPELTTRTVKERITVDAEAESNYGFGDRRNRHGTYDKYDYHSGARTRIRLSCERTPKQ